MKIHHTVSSICFVLMATVASTTLVAQPASCANKSLCYETKAFTAQVVDFRKSVQGSDQVLTVTVRYTNKTSHPLTLGYVHASGIATDDRGNRYAVYDQGVSGIGEIRNTIDTKFTLDSGESSDARFTLGWRPANRSQLIGTKYDLDLATRQIDPVAGNQYKLGREFALHYAGLGNATATATPAASATPVAAAAAPAGSTANACGTTPRCYNAGPFIATVTQVTPTRMAKGERHHTVRLNVMFRNLTNQPLILGYTAKSSKIIDNLGNQYYFGHAGTHDVSASGIGIVEGQSADPRFLLNPGEARAATFQVTRFNVGTQPLGTSFSYDLSVESLEVLPGNQVRSTRQYALTFPNMAQGTTSAAQTPGQAAQTIINLFKKKKK